MNSPILTNNSMILIESIPVFGVSIVPYFDVKKKAMLLLPIAFRPTALTTARVVGRVAVGGRSDL